jgi:putative ABC transport system permease protein
MALRLGGHTLFGWVQLAHNKVRFAMALAGVAFAVMLIFMQLGFMNMLFDTTVMLHKTLNADIVLMNPTIREITKPGTLPRRKLIQVLGVPGVESATPLYVGTVEIIRPDSGLKGQMVLLGIDPDAPPFKDPTVNATVTKVKKLGAALFDRTSRGNFSSYLDRLAQGEEPVAYVAKKNVPIVGTFELGAAFGSDGTFIVSSETFAHLSPAADSGAIGLGLVKVKSGTNQNAIAERLQAELGSSDVVVMTMDDFILRSRDFLRKDSPIAYIFSFGVIIGLFVGTVIVIQTLSTDVQDHLPEYATFKAMGFSDFRLLTIVYEQSLILTVFGFVPGYLLALGLYQLVKFAVAMPIAMPMDRVIMVFGLTAVMCMIAGTLAMRRLRSADPADVF